MTMIRYSLLIGSASLALVSVPAAADTEAQVRVSASVGIDDNPFFGAAAGDSGASLAATISIEPSIFYTDSRSNLALTGNVRYREIDGPAPADESASLSLGGATAVSERTSLNSSISFQTSRNNAFDLVQFGSTDLSALGPDEIPETIFIDPGVAGTDRRTTSLSLSTGLSHRVSERSSVSVSVSASERRIDNGFDTVGEDDFFRGRDYRTVGLTVGYARSISERTSLNITSSISKSDYLDQSFGDGFVLTPQIGLSQRVDERLSWNAFVGISYSETDDITGVTRTNTGLAGSFGLCNAGERSSLCANLSRDAGPTTFGGLSTNTSASLNYSYRLRQYDRLSLSGTYRKSNRILDDASFLNGNSEFYGATAEYRRAFSRRFSAFVNGSYGKTDNSQFDGSSNKTAMVGLSYTFGGRP